VDPSLKRLFKKDKQGILDVKVLTISGKVINIEVQVGHFTAIRPRILYYLSKLIWEQMGSGDKYERIQQVVLVLICDQNIPEERWEGLSPGMVQQGMGGRAGKPGQYLNKFVLREEGSGKIFTNLLKIITIELPKVPEEGEGDEVWPWARFFISFDSLVYCPVEPSVHACSPRRLIPALT
jgi:predicted transposase/invertase (TIGR01784 family)